ncbi:MAG: 50S ribosomal protein L18 [Planctomycetes bacterium GWA2_40_7]|nr:MAG: 50S ribosomal protein L18 [Planctomycetes bacterium GWA2_40_7]OHB47867.1 MAG: 50S ribosomal protein L18 [Planctomycetes bacterium GWF2_40_8]OHB90748.1 MAG: 50S ribosomal protein L18 [Planctomycetes bacterium RIFCSPHIGHO2_02_FULL_40_12]OHC02063.1 MAG: 50S ribosomal protein L18 [Planctomycetes bacterium RIFCSPLOWO2_12_FULL_40_19]
MNDLKEKYRKRLKRHKGIRKRVFGVKEKPRLSVYRSSKNIYCQLIDDTTGRTLASASTLIKDIKDRLPYGGNIEAAKLVGQKIAEDAAKIGITRVVFDRSGYKYHGRVKALADSARESKLVF